MYVKTAVTSGNKAIQAMQRQMPRTAQDVGVNQHKHIGNVK